MLVFDICNIHTTIQTSSHIPKTHPSFLFTFQLPDIIYSLLKRTKDVKLWPEKPSTHTHTHAREEPMPWWTHLPSECHPPSTVRAGDVSPSLSRAIGGFMKRRHHHLTKNPNKTLYTNRHAAINEDFTSNTSWQTQKEIERERFFLKCRQY